MPTTKIVLWLAAAIAVALSSCAAPASDKPDLKKLDMAAYHAEGKIYAACVLAKVLQLNAGSPDVKMIVETAVNGCSTGGLYQVLAAANFSGLQAAFFVDALRAEIRRSATEGLLTLRANAAHRANKKTEP